MVPLRDENPVKVTPYATYGLIGVNVFIFLVELVVSASSPDALQALFHQWAVVPKDLSYSFSHLSGASALEWVTVVTSQFLHAGFLHMAGNMLYLWIFGDNVEHRFGPMRFLIFYVSAGLAASIAQIMLDPNGLYRHWEHLEQSPV